MNVTDPHVVQDQVPNSESALTFRQIAYQGTILRVVVLHAIPLAEPQLP